MEFLLGIDQGGTKTQAAVADRNGNILGIGQAPGGCHTSNGIEYAIAQIKAAAKLAMDCAGVKLEQLIGLGVGMTGADLQYEYDLLRHAIKQAFTCENVTVVNDCMIALRAGTTKREAAIICAGTGLNCGVRAVNGREFVMGYCIDDYWQGGGAIAKQGLMAVFEASVGMRDPTMLTEKFLNHFQLPDVETLMESWVKGRVSHDKLKYLAQAVDQCAAENDRSSLQILSAFGKACANYALAGIRSFDMLERPVEIVLSGSIFKSQTDLLRETVASTIHEQCARAVIVEGRYEPVVGGVILAMENIPDCDPQACTDAIERSAIDYGVLRIDP